mmetsp:Transcript_20736/g.30849  ORF Transcript_20736/g.30849 Transcript_20736/m.30849 type:complete len:226 (+) Transcript_20736:58-735(+)
MSSLSLSLSRSNHSEHTDYNHKWKILVLGDEGCGKTSLIKKFCEGTFCTKDNHQKLGIGTDCLQKVLSLENTSSNEIVNCLFDVWDIPGKTDKLSITSSFYRRTDGVVLMFDTTNACSFDSLNRWVQEIERFFQGREVPCVLVGNKVDLLSDRDVEYNQGIDAAEKFHFIKYIEASNRSGVNIEEIFRILGNAILSSSHDSSHHSHSNAVLLQPSNRSRSFCCTD